MNTVDTIGRSRFLLDLLSWFILAVVLWAGAPYIGKAIEFALIQLYNFFFRKITR